MGNESEFIHLHTHSEYSLLSSTARYKDMVDRASELGMKALALTDLGNLYAAIDFYEYCQKKDVKPIMGCDIYVAPGSRFERTTGGLRDASHPLVLLAKDNVGYRNLIKLASAGFLEGFYYKPRIDKELLAEHSKGLIALSGAISSEIPHLINIGQPKKAREVAAFYKNLFDEGDFYLEIQQTHLRDQDKVNNELIKIAEELSIPLAATSNVFYMNSSDVDVLEVMYCIQNQNTLQDEGRTKLHTNQHYFKSQSEIAKDFKDLPEAVANTVKIADKCNVTIDFKTVHLPHFETPEGMTDKDYLRQLTFDGAKERYGNISDEINERLEHELKVIADLGYDSYFLIVYDFVRFARDNGIPVGPGRGSAAGSAVSYCLGITNLDPIKYDLLFERFLNPARVSMPDIDIDFCFERRDEVIQYVTDKYSKDNVAQIITFGTMLAKGVIRDVARVMGFEYSEADKIAKLVPNELNITLEEALEKEPELKDMVKNNSRVAQLFRYCRALEKFPRHASTHAAGVVISAKPLTENVPLFKTSDGQISTMHTMGSLEKINMLKFDFLGLRTLTVIDDALKIIKRTKGVEIDLNGMTMDDKLTYDKLSDALAIGVFQLESGGMRDILRKLKPDKFEDLIAVLALYRPGPIGSGMVDDFIKRKSGAIKFAYDHKLLEPILKDTYGVMVYQEQIMKIVSALAGFSLAQADLLRRAIGKKKQEVIIEQEKIFVEGCVKHNVSKNIAEKVYGLIMKFADYGFNKSHSAAYAQISFQTAYLKAHYPVEFMTALLSSEKDNSDKVVQYIDESRQMGINVLPPDVNTSFSAFTVVSDEEIRFGMAAVKNVGQNAIDSVIQARQKSGEFKSLHDFCERVDSRAVNRKTVESLIKCGAFDSLGFKRAQLMNALDGAISHAAELQKDKQVGQLSLFDTASGDSGFRESTTSDLPDVEEWSESDKLAYEKQLLGFYVTGHPLDEYKDELARYSTATAEKLVTADDGQEVLIGALITKLKFTITKKKGEKMAILTVEDLTGPVDALVFPRVFEEFGHMLAEDAIMFFKARVDKKEEQPKLIVQEIHSIKAIAARLTKSVLIRFKSGQSSEETFHKVQGILSRYSGQTPVYVNIEHDDGEVSEMIIDRSLYVSPDHDFVRSVETVLGNGSVTLDVQGAS